MNHALNGHAQAAQSILAGMSLDLSAPKTELIPINARPIDGHEVQTVNARELHAFLEVKSEFRHWIKNRIAEYGFVEGIDYVKHSLQAGMKMA
ncbi:MAG: antA/AntB antirepressor family protein, partial [Zoogloeaceae bacterium]|nr:antA/AntB antirepressor family protein [Zoogloeaceae bacterium]